MLASAAHTEIPAEITIRRQLREGDAEAIVELHRRVYGTEYERDERFVTAVADGLQAAIARGWPRSGGGVWLVERGEKLLGCLALTDEGDGSGRVRWFVLDPSVRGHRLGRALIAELVDTARAAGMARLELETFSALRAAASIYRDQGFRVVWERARSDWGPPIVYQGYELELR